MILELIQSLVAAMPHPTSTVLWRITTEAKTWILQSLKYRDTDLLLTWLGL